MDTPEGTIERPQVVLVSDNPYHIATPRYLGRRFTLESGLLGGIVVKRSAGTPPDPLPRLLRDMAERGEAGPPGEGVITCSAPRITLRGTAGSLPAGVDGEAVTLPLPVACEIRPGALSVFGAERRPGKPRRPL